MQLTTHCTVDTQQPADCLEWCTHPEFPHHFICGTYHLEEEGETDFSQAPTSTFLHYYFILYWISSLNILI